MNDRMCFALSAVLLFCAGASSAQCGRAGLIDAPIVFGPQERPIYEAGQLGPQERATILAAPSHGRIRVGAEGRFHFTPAPSFWSVGADSFTVAITSLTGTTMKTIRLLPPIVREAESSLQEAEGAPAPGSDWTLVGNLREARFVPEAALSGSLGFQVVPSPSGDTYLASTPPYPPEPPANLEGLGSSGSGGQGGWRPPGGGGGGGTGGIQPFSEAIVAALAAGSAPVISARMRTGEAGVELRLEVVGVPPTPWAGVSQEAHQLTLLGWDDHFARPQGAVLFLDGKLFASLAVFAGGLPSFGRLEARFGTMQAVGAVPAQGWDRLRAFSFRGPRPRPVCLREDRFSTRTLSSQWELFNADNVEIPGDASIDLSFGSDYLLAASPAGSGTPPGGMLKATSFTPPFHRLGVRFRMSFDELDLTPGSSIVLLDAAHGLPGPRAFRVLLEPAAGGGGKLRLGARHNDPNTPAATMIVPLPAGGWHQIELDWQRSETTLAGTGYLRLWLDGVEVGELLSLDNSDLALTDVRLGGVAQFGLPPGVLLFDDVEMWTEP